MKTYLHIILISFLSLIPLNAATASIAESSNNDKELAWVDEQIRAIFPSRTGVSEGYINSLKDPMKMKPNSSLGINGSKLLPPPKLGSNLPVIVEEPLRLQAIINKAVLINGKWYKLNDSVRNYILTEVKNSSVLLTGKKDQKLILFLTKQNSNIKITTK